MYKIIFTTNYKKDNELITIGEYDDKELLNYICLKPCNIDEYKKSQKIYNIDYDISPCVNYNKNQEQDINRSYYIAGASGSGKTYLTSIIVKSMLKKYKNDKQVIVFSNTTDEEPLYKPLKPLIYNLNNEEAINDIDDIELNNLENTITIFDDIDGNKNNVYKKLINLSNNIFVNGRKKHINCIITSHKVAQGIITKFVIQNSQYICLFPLTDKQQFIYYMNAYQNMTKSELKEIIDLVKYSRFALIHIHHPRYILHTKGIILL